MPFAVHSLFAPSVEWDGSSYSHNGRDRIVAGEPIFTADTREEAEEWRANQLSQGAGAGGVMLNRPGKD